MFEKLHEQSQDLTRATGADIPDIVWKKHHEGDKTIFSKWLAKMLNAADKKQVRNMLKSDAVFRSQATQFVRSFDKILTSAQEADNADKLAATLMKTDLGQIFFVLKGQLQ
jgi:histidinol phosphatase-like enzyme